MGPVSEHEEAAPTPAAGATSPMGRYGPLVTITAFDAAPRELEWQLPLQGELYRLIPGPDRPDYSLMVLERPLHFYPADGFDLGRVAPDARVEDRKGRPMVRVHALVVCSRFVGQQLAPGMRDLAVTIAYVIDTSVAQDAELDFAKVEVAAVGSISEGHLSPPSPDGQPGTGGDGTAGEVAGDGRGPVEDVVAEAARALRDGVAAHRGSPVQVLSATLVISVDHRLGGLSGNADGEAPVPTPETFARVNEVLSRLPQTGSAETGERSYRVRVDGDAVTVEHADPVEPVAP
ncbi:MAG: hypothetical protein JWP82_1923 [Humibacillus sp.]|nr:hypothetical protein [Humibacillus sp.]